MGTTLPVSHPSSLETLVNSGASHKSMVVHKNANDTVNDLDGNNLTLASWCPTSETVAVVLILTRVLRYLSRRLFSSYISIHDKMDIMIHRATSL